MSKRDGQSFFVPVNITRNISYLEYKNLCIELKASPLHRFEIGFEFTKNRNIRFSNVFRTHPMYQINWQEQSELQSEETFIPKGHYEFDIRSYNNELWNEENIRPIHRILCEYGLITRDPSTYDYRTDNDLEWNENDEHTVADNPNRFNYYIGKRVRVEIEDSSSSLLKINRILRKDDNGYYVQINKHKQYLNMHWLDGAEFD